jgi:HAD superfamily 5'-nucleotidase-like hydrolase
MKINNSPIPRSRQVFCNRTLNFRALKAIGYDMDYTLVEYHVEIFERKVYQHAIEGFKALGWPVDGLCFDPGMATRGLVVDAELGNIVKANRFGFIKKAVHGTRELGFGEQRETYSRTIVDLNEPRWQFLNTLFSISEGCLYAQLVDLLDEGRLPHSLGYAELYSKVRTMVDSQHAEGRLKPEIMQNPSQYIDHDQNIPLTLLDQFHAGKKLFLVTNSDWAFASAIMAHAFDPLLPNGMNWKDLFSLVIADARKPDFFTTQNPFYEIVGEDGLLRAAKGPPQTGRAYSGGCAALVEKTYGISGDEIMYVGDHLFTDVHVTKNVLRWRTALILRELENEIQAIEAFAGTEQSLDAGMEEKESVQAQMAEARIALQRLKSNYGPQPAQTKTELETQIKTLRERLTAIDDSIAPQAQAANELVNPRWGLLTRTGSDKSHLARQVERYADIYTSRVSNLLLATPYAYFRSHRGSLAHDP